MAYYGCLRFHKRGLHACRNGLQIRQDALDAAVVDVLVKALEPDVLAEAYARRSRSFRLITWP
jgi:hypothetical protein